MELKKLTLAMLAASSVALTGCGSDDDDKKEVVVDPRERCATVGYLPLDGETIVVGDTATPICDLEGTISESTTLTSDYVYRLNGYVTVGDGHEELAGATPSSITLTVNPGVQFRSTGRGSLVITRGSKLMANGTESAPIVMSSFDAGYDGQGEWGGLVLQGYAKNNNCPAESTGNCDVADEAGTGFHGGNNDADNSGEISYLIVAEGGYEIAPDEEVNGITLHSVGYGTTIENVMVYANADDGIEFFGGAANVKNLILVDNGDESLDWDDGWRGNVQFALVRQGVSYEGDHGIEADTAGKANDAIPESNPTIANVTFQENAEGADDLFRFKKGTEGTLVNVAADGYEECVKAEGSDVSVTLTNVIAECDAYDIDSDNHNYAYVTGGKKVNSDESKGDIVTAADVLAADNNAIASLSGIDTAGADAFGNNTVELGQAFEVTGGNGSVTTVTPASANASTGFFVATDYVGAVAPTVTAAESAWWAWAADVIPAAFAQ